VLFVTAKVAPELQRVALSKSLNQRGFIWVLVEPFFERGNQ
jgi:hypothetical protein